LLREKKNLLPTGKGISLIAILPDKVKSPLLTAEWENNLKRMERGKVAAHDFMKSINDFVSGIVHTYGRSDASADSPFHSGNSKPAENASSGRVNNDAGGQVSISEASIGVCRRCGGNVTESPKAFSCEYSRSKNCGFILWKDNKLLSSQGKKLTKGIATQLISGGRVFIPDLKSQKTGKTYGATVVIQDKTDGYVEFALEFSKNK